MKQAWIRAVIGCVAGTVAGSLLICGQALALPAGWAYELVSPPDSLGADLDFASGSPSGNRAWISTLIPLTADSPTGQPSTLEATRTPTGWRIRDLADDSSPNNDTAEFQARSADGSAAIVEVCPAVALACDKFVRFERVTDDGSRSVVLDVPSFQLGEAMPEIIAVSDDASTVLIRTPPDAQRPLSEDTHTRGGGLYASVDGNLEFLGFDDVGNVLDCGAILGHGTTGGGFEQNGISADAATVFYESPDPAAGCSSIPVDVYVHRAGSVVNASAPRNSNPDMGSTYLGNSRDGNVMYFMTASQLVASDTDNFGDIYEYDVPTDTVARITPGADVRGAVVSPQGDYVYFKAFNAIDGMGTSGKRNLFVYHAGEIQLIATADDGRNFELGGGTVSLSLSPLTPDGKHLLFLSASELTGQPLDGTVQLFRYDFTDNTMTCVSCSANGAPLTANIPLPTPNPVGNADQRFQSDDGRLIVFHTLDRLLPQDVNDNLDVYMWRDGVLSLVSSGRSRKDAIAVSTDAAGHNVFFTSNDRLTPDVEQDNTKLYDARLGGGFPFDPPVPDCQGDSCRPPLSDNASYAAGGSQTFLGPGNGGGQARSARVVALKALSRDARRTLLRDGRVTLAIRVGKPGRVRVRLTTTIHGHRVVLATATRTGRRAGTLRVRIRLGRHAHELRAGGVVRFTVTLGGSHAANRTVKLPGGT